MAKEKAPKKPKEPSAFGWILSQAGEHKPTRMPLGSVLDRTAGGLKNILVERIDAIETTLAHIVPENEKDLMDAIRALTKEKTVVMIAHRLKTVEHADQILVVDKGRIVQAGTHEELVAVPGIYQNFIAARREAVGWKL